MSQWHWVLFIFLLTGTTLGYPESKKRRFPFQLHPNSPKGELVINYRELPDSTRILPFNIEVRQGGHITHVIELDQSYHEGFAADAELVTVADYNFDTYQDLATLTIILDGNIQREVLLYDKDSRLFVRNQGMSELTAITVLPDKKELRSIHKGLVGSHSFDEAYFQVQQPGNRLVAVRDIRQELNKDKRSYTRIERVLKNGRMVEAKRTTVHPKD